MDNFKFTLMVSLVTQIQFSYNKYILGALSMQILAISTHKILVLSTHVFLLTLHSVMVGMNERMDRKGGKCITWDDMSYGSRNFGLS